MARRPPRPDADRRRRALRFTEEEVARRVSGVTLTPHWIGDDRFWFRGPGGCLAVVDPDRGTLDALAAPPGDDATPAAPPGALRSPDGRWDLLRQGGDLILRSCADGGEVALTTDAERWWDYGGTPDSSVTGLTLRRSVAPLRPVAVWSPRSDRVLTHRIDQRAVRRLPLVEAAPAGGSAPILQEVRVPLPGDKARPTAELLVFDVPAGGRRTVGEHPLLVQFFSPLELGWVWWGAETDTVWYLTETLGARSLKLHLADLRTGSTRVVVEELAPVAEGSVHPAYVEPHPLLPWPNHARPTPGDRAVIWPSERDGWRHLYRYEVGDKFGQGPPPEPQQLTRGEWVVRDVVRVDGKWVWFTGLGREVERDPYLRHLYRARLKGGEPELLTPEPGDHTVTFTPSGRYFVDSVSTIATAPEHRLRRADGSLVRELATADLSTLRAEGWNPPRPFRVPAADGRTPLF
ncbi:MAG: DPP IV N-terminal domain-containing protein, partial [Candidatus Dormibacteraceae bacterium]